MCSSYSACRLCLHKQPELEMIKLFNNETDELETHISSILLAHLWFLIIENDEHSKLICLKCWQTIKQFHLFYVQIKNAQKNLFNTSNNRNVDGIDFITEHKQQIIKLEDINDDTSSSLFVQPNVAIKVEEVISEPDLKIIPKTVVTKQSSTISLASSTVNAKIKRKRTKLKSTNPIITDGNNKNNSNINNHDVNSDKDKCEDQNVVSIKKKKRPQKIIKNNKNIEIEDQQIRDFYKMTCNLCDFNFSNFLNARSHYTSVHQQSAYLMCCSKKFYRRNRLLDHMNQHLNPNAFKCPECNKTFADKFVLKNHIENHAPMDKRQFKCDICSSSFTKLYKLSQHMQITHCLDNEKKFQCSECGNSFITKSKLTTHIRSVHEFAYAQICHICAKTLKSKNSYELHQREHLNVEVAKVQCKVCNSWLKNDNCLRRHIARHNAESVRCNLCNKIAPNKDALGSHIREIHRERPFKCTLCEKAFTKSRGLREHVASHTGEDIYNCSYCPKTFKASASLHLHRKKIHPDEWQFDRVNGKK